MTDPPNMPTDPIRVLLVSIDADAGLLEAAVRDAGLPTEVDHAGSPEAAVEAIQSGAVDVCFAPSTAGPDPSASLTLALARVGAYVPVVAVVDEPSAGFEAIADEGAADFVWRGDLSPQSVGRALLVAHARAEAVARFQAVQSGRDALLAATGSVAVMLDGGGRLVDLRAAPSLETDFGEAAPGVRFASLFSADARAGAVEAMRQAHAGRTGRFVQTRARAGRPLLLRWSVAQTADGYQAIAVDRTEANREAYRADMLRVVLDSILRQLPVTVFVVDADGAFLLVLGEEYGSVGLQGVSIFDAYRDEPQIVANVRRALGGETFDDLVTIRDGRRYKVRYAPFELGASEAAGALGVATNVTVSVFGDAERSRLEVATGLSSSLTVVVDSEGTATYLSPALRDLVGLTAESLGQEGGIGRLFESPALRTEIARAVRSGDAWSGPAAVRSAAGGTVPVQVRAEPVFDPDGARIGAVAQFDRDPDEPDDAL